MKNQEKTKQTSKGRKIPGYSYTTNGQPISDEQIKEWISKIITEEGHAYGYLKITIILQRNYDLTINKKKVYRLCKEMKLLRPQRKMKTKYPKRLSRNRKITAPNQLWEADIKYGFIAGEQRFFFTLSFIDVYDRSIVGYYTGLSCEAKHAVQTLKQALLRRNLYNDHEKPIVRTDNGPQFISKLFEEICHELEIEHERIPCRTPNKNAHIESFHRILEDECMGGQEFATYLEAYETVSQFMDYYNKTRIHSSIKYLAPNQFYQKFMKNEIETQAVLL